MWGNLDYESTAPINAVLAVQEDSSLYPYEEEPVSVADFKAQYSKIDFADEDILIESLLKTSRLLLEKLTGLSFVPKRLTCQLQNDCGNIEIPYGPMYGALDTTLVTDFDGEEIEIETYGLDFLSIRNKVHFVQIIYDCGYVDLPEDLKTAIKAQTFFLYVNRGNEVGVNYVCGAAEVLCSKYRRVWDVIF